MSKPKNPCRECKGLCCKYFGFEIDTPETRHEFDNLRWYLAHKGVTIYVNKGKWFIEIKTPCRHLTKDFQCDIYEFRPQVCRHYKNTGCESEPGDYGYKLCFKNDAEMTAYIAQKFSRRVP